jgi:hypothetical protein
MHPEPEVAQPLCANLETINPNYVTLNRAAKQPAAFLHQIYRKPAVSAVFWNRAHVKYGEIMVPRTGRFLSITT